MPTDKLPEPTVKCPKCGRMFPIMSQAEGRRILLRAHKTPDGERCDPNDA